MRRAIATAVLVILAALAGMASAAVRPEDVSVSRAAVAPPPPAPSERAAYIAPSRPAEPSARQDPATVRRSPKIRWLLMPIAGHAIPTDPLLLPGSDRSYRAGVHEGIDVPAPTGTPVLAAADGVIVRVDRDYVDAPLAARNAALAAAQKLGYTPAATLDLVRGRQVWIDHGNGIVTRYCHLSTVEPLAVGSVVKAGERVAAVGSTGLPENGPHLHFEVRIGDDFLGDGLSGADLERAVDLAFR